MAREPVPGKVKTRLAASVGERAAVSLYEAMLTDALALAGCFARVTPAGEALVLVAGDPAPVRRLAGAGGGLRFGRQMGADLAARLEQAVVRARGEGVGPLLVMGTDCPQITLARLQDALACLRAGRAALAPSPDGGYALLGLPKARLVPGLFSRPNGHGALEAAEALERLARGGLEPVALAPVADVDTLADVRGLLERPGSLVHAPATQACLRGEDWRSLAGSVV